MAFVNEYVSEEDIKKYGIREIWKLFHPRNKNLDVLMTSYSWTVDKDNQVFFFPVISGKEEASNQEICALWWKGTLLSVTLAKLGGELDFANRTGSIVWGLVDIWKPDDFLVSDEEIKSVLKDALTAYQLDGIRNPMKEYFVSFKF